MLKANNNILNTVYDGNFPSYILAVENHIWQALSPLLLPAAVTVVWAVLVT